MMFWLAVAGCSSLESAPADPPAPVVRSLVEPVRPPQLRERIYAASGQRRLVNFWATWCPPCRAEMPQIRDWARLHPEVEVILVNADVPTLRESKVIPFVHEFDLTHLTHWSVDHPDPAAAMPALIPRWKQSLPVTLVLDEQGEIIRRFDRLVREADLAEL